MTRYPTWAHCFLLSMLIFAVLPAALWAQGFAASEILAAGMTGAFGVDAADFDGDGDIDVAVSLRYPAASVAWLENRGAAVMTTHVIWTGADVRKIVAGDFTQDGRPDIVLASYDVSSGQFILARNNGGQTVNYFNISSVCSTATGAYAVSSADLDADQDLDLVTAEYRGNVVRVFRNDPAGLLQIAAVQVMAPYDVHFADLDNDGDMDVVGCSESRSLFWLEHQDSLWIFRDLGFGSNCQSVAVADLDGDGDSDIVAASYSGSAVNWWENSPAGFTPHPLAGVIVSTTDIKIADFDQDGLPDIVAVGQTGNIHWWKNNGDHTFAMRTIPTVNGAMYNNITVVDYDLDGDLDLIVADASPEHPAVRLFRNTMGISAYVAGRVISDADGQPIAGAEIRLAELGASTRSDSTGRFRLTCAAGIYTVIVSKPCWNSLERESVHIAEAETTAVDFSLQRPAYDLALTSLNLMIQNHEIQNIPIPIVNSGDGVLHIAAEAEGAFSHTPWLSVIPQSADVAAGDSVTFWVRAAPDTSDLGNWDYSGWIRFLSNACPDTVRTVAVIAYVLDTPNRIPSLPGRTALIGAYPNPFNGSTTVQYELANPTLVEVNLFDLMGREVRHFQRQQNAGVQQMAMDAEALPSGVYVLGLKLGSQMFSQKLLLIR